MSAMREALRLCRAVASGYERASERHLAIIDAALSAPDEADELRDALSKAQGYLTNALIDLQTGAKKATAIATIEGGLKVVREALLSRSGGG